MKKIRIGVIIVLSYFLCALMLNNEGSPGAKTGSPADGSTCTQCHEGTAIEADNWITSTIPDSGYVAGETYTITATGTHQGVNLFGFELTAEDNSNAKKGTFIITNATETQLYNNIKSVTHTSAGITPSNNSKSWSFDWTAPEQGTGNITFYAAFNAANGNGATSGDVIYKSSLAVTENTTSGIHLYQYNEVFPTVYQDVDPNTLIINYHDKNEKVIIIRIFDITGKQLISARKINETNNNIKLNIKDLKTNIYYIQVETKNQLRTRKILILK